VAVLKVITIASLNASATVPVKKKMCVWFF